MHAKKRRRRSTFQSQASFSLFFSFFFFFSPYPTRVDRSSTTDWCNCVTGSSSKVTDRPSWPPPSRRAHNVCKYVDEATVRIPPDILPYKRRRFLTGGHCPAIGLTIKTIVSGSSWNYLSCWEIGGGFRRDSFVRGQVYLGIEFLELNIFFWDEILININDGGLERSTIDGLFANVWNVRSNGVIVTFGL